MSVTDKYTTDGKSRFPMQALANNGLLYVLANDGTLWEMHRHGCWDEVKVTWKRVEGLPQQSNVEVP